MKEEILATKFAENDWAASSEWKTAEGNSCKIFGANLGRKAVHQSFVVFIAFS